jgi:hypothetical protein
MKKLLKESVRGKYAQRYAEGTNVVLLDSDLADAFPTAEAVNEALRLVLRLSKIPAVDNKRPTTT